MLEKSQSSLFSSFWPFPKPHFHHQTPAGMTTKSKLAAHKVSFKSVTIVPNVMLQMSSIQSIKDADHVQLITSSTLPLNNVTARFHVNSQDNLTLTTSVNAQQIKKETKEFGINQTEHAVVHQTFHSGTESTVLPVQLEPNSIQRNINATTAPTDSSEISTATPVSQDFDCCRIYFLYLAHFVLFKAIFSNLKSRKRWLKKLIDFFASFKILGGNMNILSKFQLLDLSINNFIWTKIDLNVFTQSRHSRNWRRPKIW